MQARSGDNPLEHVRSAVSQDELMDLQETAAQVYVDEAILHYIAELSAATRSHALIRLGVSPRGSLALCAVARAAALVRGRDYVIPDDIRIILDETFAHRLLLTPRAKAEKRSAEQILGEILDKTPEPPLKRYHA